MLRAAKPDAQARQGKLHVPILGHSRPVVSVAFSDDGVRVLSGSSDNTIKLWDAATGALIRTFEGHSNVVSSVAFSPNGARVLSGSFDYTIKLWDAADPHLRGALQAGQFGGLCRQILKVRTGYLNWAPPGLRGGR